ncbi:unnamed protein product [Protopolystoma xenopodis]|uniref:Uncharacterized protein n=1 Tax=Protopolystoma xenopodis TaxID=117903 RepID=A0A448XGB5_9PLAT|nr:unnamed protein product [Protopolystoma xenopodis]
MWSCLVEHAPSSRYIVRRMAKLTDDVDYDAGEMFEHVPSPLSDAGTHENYYGRRRRTSIGSCKLGRDSSGSQGGVLRTYWHISTIIFLRRYASHYSPPPLDLENRAQGSVIHSAQIVRLLQELAGNTELQIAILTDDADYHAGETFGNVPSQWSNAGNHEYYARRHETRYVPPGLRRICKNKVKPTL